ECEGMIRSRRRPCKRGIPSSSGRPLRYRPALPAATERYPALAGPTPKGGGGMAGRSEEEGRRISAELWQVLGRHRWRFSSTLFNEWRDLLFVRVTLTAVAAYAQKTFSHLHALGPRFHARRKLGSLLPDIDRGTSGIAFLLGVGLFTIVPTLVEIGLVLAIMLNRYAAGFAGIILLTFLVYAGF